MDKNESGKTLIMWSDLLPGILITDGSQKTSKSPPKKNKPKKLPILKWQLGVRNNHYLWGFWEIYIQFTEKDIVLFL